MKDNLDALLAVQNDNGGKRALRAVVAAAALVALGIGAGASAVLSGRTFADEQIAPVKQRVHAVEQKQEASDARFREHAAQQAERERALFETLAELKRGQAEVVKAVQEVKERCIEGGGCSERKRRH